MGEKISTQVTSDPKEFRRHMQSIDHPVVQGWSIEPYADVYIDDHGTVHTGNVWRMDIQVDGQGYRELIVLLDRQEDDPNLQKIFLVTLYDRANMLHVGFPHERANELVAITTYQAAGIEPLPRPVSTRRARHTE